MRLHARDESEKLCALALSERAGMRPRLSQQCQQSHALGWLELCHVASQLHSELADQEQAPERDQLASAQQSPSREPGGFHGSIVR